MQQAWTMTRVWALVAVTLPVWVLGGIAGPDFELLLSRAGFLVVGGNSALAVAGLVGVGVRVWGVVLTAPVLVVAWLEVATFHITGATFGYSFAYHAHPDALEVGLRAWPWLTGLCVGGLVFGFVGVWVLAAPQDRPFAVRRLGWPLLFGVGVVMLPNPAQSLVRAMQPPAEEYSDEQRAVLEHFGLPTGVVESPPLQASPGRNLLLVYLEGLEATFMDEELFPGLTPNLKRLAAQGSRLVDYRPRTGSNTTMSNIVSTQCGLPFLARSEVADLGPGLQRRCLGDVLDRAGYEQVFLGGADLGFSGKGQFLSGHGYDRVLGRAELRSLLGGVDENPWGIHDGDLLGHAAKLFKRLAESPEPFNLTVLTLDTHPPSGFPSDDCPAYEPNPHNRVLRAVHCTDALIGDFIATIRTHPRWQDTVVALVADHTMHRNSATHLLERRKQRRLTGILLNTDLPKVVRAPISPIDLGPSLLQLLGVEHNAPFVLSHNFVPRATSPKAPLTLYDRGRPGLDTLRAFVERNMRPVPLCGSLITTTKGPPAALMLGEHTMVPMRDQSPRMPGRGLVYALRATHGGHLRSASLVSRAELAALVSDNPEDLYLVVGRRNDVPDWLVRGEMPKQGHWLAVVSRPLSSVSPLVKSFGSFASINVGSLECAEVQRAPSTGASEVLAWLRSDLRLHDREQVLRQALSRRESSLAGFAGGMVTSAPWGMGDSTLVMGETVVTGSRGLNLVTLDEDLTLVGHRAFDTHGDREAAGLLIEAFQSAQPSHTLILFAHDTATYGAGPEPALARYFGKLGAKKFAGVRNRQGYVLVYNEWRRYLAEAREPSLIPTTFALDVGPLTRPRKWLPTVAHAGGNFAGRTYTNSLEAMDRAYADGLRYFEIDFVYTSDDRLVCLHDWRNNFHHIFGKVVGDDVELPLDLATFRHLVDTKVDMTPCDAERLAAWLKKHPDAYLVTDLKDRVIQGLEVLLNQYGLRKQLIGQVYDPEDIPRARRLGVRRIIWSLYRYGADAEQVRATLTHSPPDVLCMPSKIAAETKIAQLAAEFGVPVYAHTVNHRGEAYALFHSAGVDGIYTDYITDLP